MKSNPARYDHALTNFRTRPPVYAYGLRVSHKFLVSEWIANQCEGRVRPLPYRPAAGGLAHSKFFTFRYDLF